MATSHPGMPSQTARCPSIPSPSPAWDLQAAATWHPGFGTIENYDLKLKLLALNHTTEGGLLDETGICILQKLGLRSFIPVTAI